MITRKPLPIWRRFVNKAEFSPQFEPAFFSLGSAFFNAGNYPKAITAFKNYQTKFPNGPHTADVVFGLAQSNLLTKNYGGSGQSVRRTGKRFALQGSGVVFQRDRE